MFELKPCYKCGGYGKEHIGYGFEHFLCGVPMGAPFGTYVECTLCGHRTDSYDEPWKAIRAWNRQPMMYEIDDNTLV